jgi:hypothetical protein
MSENPGLAVHPVSALRHVSLAPLFLDPGPEMVGF